MTITELLLNFRDALRSVTPMVEQVGMPWRRPDAYDEWDAIALALFNALVVEVLRWSLPGALQESFRLPAYDLLLPDYAELSTLEVSHPALSGERMLFHAFGTTMTPFDTVEALWVSPAGAPRAHDLSMCPIHGCHFRLRLHTPVDGNSLLEAI